MKTIHAIYEGGVFKPTEAVDLPEHCHVRFEPVPVAAPVPAPPIDLTPFRGILSHSAVDPLEYQRQIREEWG